MFLWGGVLSGRLSFGQVVLVSIVFFFLYGFFGSVTGMIIGLSNASESRGTAIGVGMGLSICVLELLVFRDPLGLISLLFYFITGQYVGSGIAGRVQQPLRPRAPYPAMPATGAADPSSVAPPAPGASDTMQ